MQIWRQSNGPHKIDVPANYVSVYDDNKEKYPNLADALIKNLDIRRNLLKPFHHICLECGLDWINTKSIFDAIKEIKKEYKIPDDRMNKIEDLVKNIPVDFIKNYSPTSLRIFLNNVKENDFDKSVLLTKDDSVPINRFFSNAVTNSFKLREIISILNKFSVLQNTGTNFNLCGRCSKVSISPNNICLYCGKPDKVEQYPMLYLSQKIFSGWEDGEDKFIEAMIYHAIKKNLSPYKVYSNVNVIDKKLQKVREIDVFIRDTNFAILATTNPFLPTEKNQAKELEDMDFDVIVVTTKSSGGGMEKSSITTPFTNIIGDSNFPQNLIDFLKDNKALKK